MTVKELRDKLNEIPNQNLRVIVLTDDIRVKEISEVFEDEIRYIDMMGNLIEEPKKCLRII